MDRGYSLVVNSKSLEAVYREYLAGAYTVNRRYQRKLVWTVEEKQLLIDSIIHGYPLPLFLVAEDPSSSPQKYEIIDGMQRLNAIVSFVENEYPVHGEYFDLEAIASTKELKDRGELEQREPKLDRRICVDFATYTIAHSAYQSAQSDSVEEVFRRINSSGQKLSKQDLRQAGSVSVVADLVRDLSSRIRGDSSPSHLVDLGDMKALSISSAQTKYGISPENIFWVNQGVLDRSGVRSSADEQLVLDLVADMLFDPLLNTGTTVRDSLFELPSPKTPQNTRKRIAAELADSAWLSTKKESVAQDFMQTFERVERILEHLPASVNFKKHIGKKSNNPIPRYFEALFAAVYQLAIKENRELTNPLTAVQLLENAEVFHAMPDGGGEWTHDKKKDTVAQLVDRLRCAFDDYRRNSHGFGPSNTLSSSAFDALITGALLEAPGRELKQGFLRLEPENRAWDESSFEKMMRTLTAISNTHPTQGGTILVGVADSAQDAQRIELLDNVTASSYRSLNIVGIDREWKIRGESLDKYWDMIIDKIANCSKLPNEYAHQVASRCQVTKHNQHTLAVLTAPEVTDPVPFDHEYYSRVNSMTIKAADVVSFTRDFDERRRRSKLA